MASQVVQLSITAVTDADGLHGSIRGDDEPSAEFDGWLGLLTALNRLLTDSDGATRQRGHSTRERT